MDAFVKRVRSAFPFSSSSNEDESAMASASSSSNSQPFTFATLVKSYVGDWILVFVLWFGLGYLYRMGGNKRRFSLTDISIQYPMADPETVGSGMLLTVSAIIPTCMVILVGGAVYRNRWDVHNGLLAALMSYTMTGFITQVIKMGVGRPRPDLINRCMPIPGSTDHAVWGLSTAEICTQTNMRILNDGFKSFPSGHSSLSFAGLGFLSFYLAGKLHLGDKRGHRTRAWLAFAPLLGATMVAVSRTADNRHHWQDVTVGSLLGLAISFVSYRAYFPSLAHKFSHLPLAPRSAAPSALHVPDEEEAAGLPKHTQLNTFDDDEESQGLMNGGEERVVPREGENL